MIKYFLSLIGFILTSTAVAQDYDYYFTGDTSDVSTSPAYGICLMGGATEDDNGAEWFLNKADGGNIVVIRASGSDGYNDYFFNQLGINVQSVETIVFNSANASSSAFIQRRIQGAEAIWIAGGDQFIYESYWKNTPIENLINDHIVNKGYPIGGTSAGMAILGEHYFNAENGTVTSAASLNDPMNNAVSLSSDFISVPQLSNTITDTHFDNPDRQGRLAVFLARLLMNNNSIAFGIAADEYVAICIDQNGRATVFGQHPDFDDFAYFVRTNCPNIEPSVITANSPLTWSPASTNALQVCVLEGTSSGSQQFDLNEWQAISGGEWYGWNITNGSLESTPSNYISCDLSIENLNSTDIHFFPNPATDKITFVNPANIRSIQLLHTTGQLLNEYQNPSHINVTQLKNGAYILIITLNTGNKVRRKLIVQSK